ncbi:hypothetical protein HYALB_00002476 [Hymenoscyphus albidus]|uniref:Uncharacterized protein n=1 Tax=Hymenoscyphus albidus TaxID=595503 RepID=A0A9N9Q4F8_9HELO|nr:hypothetical protein HYALB_00002476 [Hymenoscyphus albidus]
MSLRENRPPRLASRPVLTKKTSLNGLREFKSKPTSVSSDKPLIKTAGLKTALRTRTIRSSPRASVRPVLSPGKRIGLRQPDFNPKVAAAIAREEIIQGEAKAAKVSEDTAWSPVGHGHPDHPEDPSETSLSQLLSKAGIAPPLPSKSSRRSLVSTYTTISDDENEDLEEKIRNALTPPEFARRAQTPSSIKSVRWDPAIISYGSIKSGIKARHSSPEPGSPCPKSRNDFAKALRTISQLDKKEQRAVCKLLLALDVTESDEEPIISPKSHGEKSLECVAEEKVTKKLNPEAPVFRDFSILKKNIVQNKNIDEGEQGDKAVPRVNCQPPVVTSTLREAFTKPAQPPIVTSTPLKSKRDPKEPTWVNIFNPPPPEDMPQGFPALPAAVTNSGETSKVAPMPDLQTSQPLQPMFPFHPFPMGMPGLTDSVWVQIPMHILQNPYGLPPMIPPQGPWNNATIDHTTAAPQISQAPRAPRAAAQSTPPNPPKVCRPPVKPRMPRGPLIDVSSSFIPPDDGPCRVTHADNLNEAWRQSLLDKFIAKYPQTGTASEKAQAQAPGHMPQAAAIQQHLELLIFQERERTALEGGVSRKNKRKFSANGFVDHAPANEPGNSKGPAAWE